MGSENGMQHKNLVPEAEWTPCGQGLPPVGRFVWICVGRVIEAGAARRYEREVHLGVYRGPMPAEQFQIYPYSMPMVSNQVWAWAPITPPIPPVCRHDDPIEGSYGGEDTDEEEEE